MPAINNSFDTTAAERTALRKKLSQTVDTAITKGEYAAALQWASEAAARYEADGDSEGQALTFCLLGKCYRYLGDLPTSLEKHDKSHELHLAMKDNIGCADVLQARAGTLRLMGRDDEAMQDLKQSGTIYREAGERLQETRTLMSVAILYKQAGNIAASQELLYECLPFFEQNGHTGETAKVLLNIATNYNVLLNTTEAIRFAKRGIPLFEATEDLHNLSMALCVLGASYLKQNDCETALEQFRAALQVAQHVGIRWASAIILGDIGDVLMRQKQFGEARKALERSIELNRGDEYRLVYCENLQRLGSLYAHPEYTERDSEKAFAYLYEARREAEEQNTGMLLVSIHKTLTELHERGGNFREALESFRAYHDTEKRLFNEESDKRIKRLEVEKAQKDAEIAHLRMVELAQALDEAEQLRRLAEEQARTDALTGLLNRRALDEFLQAAFERSQRMERSLTVALVDIDFFKNINDTLGHDVGDAALRYIGPLLRAQCRSEDRAARYGGEEFALVFPDTERCVALAICERLRAFVAAQTWTAIHPGLASLTVSVGVSAASDDLKSSSRSLSALLAEADQNLYQAKRSGRNQVVG